MPVAGSTIDAVVICRSLGKRNQVMEPAYGRILLHDKSGKTPLVRRCSDLASLKAAKSARSALAREQQKFSLRNPPFGLAMRLQ